jgi:hypothetical protein
MIRLSQNPTQAQADAVKAAGNGACVQHPRAGTRKGRARLARQLVALGVPSSATATLGWVTGAELAELEPESELSPEEE